MNAMVNDLPVKGRSSGDHFCRYDLVDQGHTALEAKQGYTGDRSLNFSVSVHLS
jgi:hypothetical protein